VLAYVLKAAEMIRARRVVATMGAGLLGFGCRAPTELGAKNRDADREAFAPAEAGSVASVKGAVDARDEHSAGADGSTFDIDPYLSRAAPSVLSCIAENVTPLPPGGPAPRGVFEITYVLGTDGRLGNIAFVRPSGHSVYVDRCVVRKLMSLHLPAPPAPVGGHFTF